MPTSSDFKERKYCQNVILTGSYQILGVTTATSIILGGKYLRSYDTIGFYGTNTATIMILSEVWEYHCHYCDNVIF